MIAPHGQAAAIALQLPAQVVIAWPVTLSGASTATHAATLEITVSLDSPMTAARCLLREGGGASLRTLPIPTPPTATFDPAADLLHLDGPHLAATILLAGPSPRLLYARFRLGQTLTLGPGSIEEPALLGQSS
ncbi:MAG: hypothetical protein ACREJO_15320 [Phycisphaerales bacterium]